MMTFRVPFFKKALKRSQRNHCFSTLKCRTRSCRMHTDKKNTVAFVQIAHNIFVCLILKWFRKYDGENLVAYSMKILRNTKTNY